MPAESIGSPPSRGPGGNAEVAGTARPVVGQSTISTSGSGRRRGGSAPWLLIPATVEALRSARWQLGTDTPSVSS